MIGKSFKWFTCLSFWNRVKMGAARDLKRLWVFVGRDKKNIGRGGFGGGFRKWSVELWVARSGCASEDQGWATAGDGDGKQ